MLGVGLCHMKNIAESHIRQNALTGRDPNATFIGFTGTPIDFDDKSTVEVFGDYIDIYDMTQAVEDGATVPIYYENRTAKLKLNAELLKKIDAEYEKLASEASEIAIEKSKSDLLSIEAIIGSKERLGMLADDIIAHYEDRQEQRIRKFLFCQRNIWRKSAG